MITMESIQPGQYKRGGQIYQCTETQNRYNAEITPKKEIRIFGIYCTYVKGDQVFDKTFRIGDEAEYDSYNLIYTGKIVSIGNKTITIESHGEKHRLTIYNFSRKNWDFDQARIAKHNTEEMFCI